MREAFSDILTVQVAGQSLKERLQRIADKFTSRRSSTVTAKEIQVTTATARPGIFLAVSLDLGLSKFYGILAQFSAKTQTCLVLPQITKENQFRETKTRPRQQGCVHTT